MLNQLQLQSGGHPEHQLEVMFLQKLLLMLSDALSYYTSSLEHRKLQRCLLVWSIKWFTILKESFQLLALDKL